MRTFIVFLVVYLASWGGMILSARVDVGGVLDTVYLLWGIAFGNMSKDSPPATWNGLLFCGFWAAKCVSQIGMAWVLFLALIRAIRSPRVWPMIVKSVGISTNASTGRLQFGIATLLWAMLLASVLMSLYVVKLKPIQAQRAALAALEPFDCRAKWVFGNVDRLFIGDGTRKIDDSVMPLLRPFRRVRFLRLHGRQITGDGLAEVPGKELEVLILSHTSVTDSALAGLDRMPKLKNLHLDDTLVTDAGVSHLLSLVQLKDLWLSDTGVTDEGLRILSEHPNLRELDICRTRITDEGLKHLGNLGSLKTLFLDGTPITDEGLEHLEKLNLTKLCLVGTPITGEGLGRLRSLSHLDLTNTQTNDAALREIGLLEDLWAIDLDGTNITDQGLEHLHGLKNLLYVDIRNTAVSPSAVERLRQALPEGVSLEAPPTPPGQASQRPLMR